jgi:hypothetical protein
MHPTVTATPKATTITLDGVDDLPDELQEAPAGGPTVVFRSDLVLTVDQESRLVNHCLEWYRILCDELGRNQYEEGTDEIVYGSRDSLGPDQLKFFQKRARYARMAKADFSHRKVAGTIFDTSNLSAPVVRRVATQLSARLVKYFFGTDPWLAVQAIGAADKETADALNRLVTLKMRANNNQAHCRRAISTALDLGEAVLKTTFKRRKTRFSRQETVLVDTRTNAIVVDSEGAPVLPTDKWVAIDPNDPTSNLVLRRDPSTVHPGLQFVREELRSIEGEDEHYAGPSIRPVYYRDFLCPRTAETIDEAPCVIEVNNLSLTDVMDQFSDMLGAPGSEDTIKRLRAAMGGDDTIGGASAVRPELAEDEQPTNNDANQEVLEFGVQFDAEGDGLAEQLYVAICLKTRQPIFYNYLANVTDDGKRPWTAIVPRPVEGRWYGIGLYEQHECYQDQIDLQLNRRNVSQGAAGRITMWQPQNTLEGQMNPDLQLNWGRTYTLAPGKKSEDTVSVVYLTDNKFEQLTKEIEFWTQLLMNESGVANANDSYVSGLDTSKLATGIRNIEKSGQELTGVYISEVEGCIAELVEKFLRVLVANIEDNQLIEIFDSNVPRSLTLAKSDITDLQFNVEVLLTRYKEEQSLASNQAAVATIRDYYGLPPALQQILRPFYVDLLSSYQVKEPEQYIVPQMVPLLPPQGGAAPPPVPSDPPAEPNL